MQPLVSVICLSYNHEQYLSEALTSIQNQSYPNLEVILVDDASTDASAAIIEDYCFNHPAWIFIKHLQNTGNTKAFNEAWQRAKGEFVIDFATDDVMCPDRIWKQVTALQQAGPEYGVCYSNAALIDEKSQVTGYHYNINKAGKSIQVLPSGNIFKQVLRRYFINPPSMVFRREVLEKLNGYDETLTYEDFDFWIRSARYFNYIYLDDVLVQHRIHPKSLSQQFNLRNNKLAASSVKVCRKAQDLIQTEDEKLVLIDRVKAEIRLAFFTENFAETLQLCAQLQELTRIPVFYRILRKLAKKQVRLSFIRKFYYQIRYSLF